MNPLEREPLLVSTTVAWIASDVLEFPSLLAFTATCFADPGTVFSQEDNVEQQDWIHSFQTN